MTIGEKIKAIRTAQGLTQKQVGELCEPKIHEVQIRKYERGEVTPKLQNAVRIAAALGVQVAELYGDDWEHVNYEGHTQHYPPFMQYLGSLGYRIFTDYDSTPFGKTTIQVPNGNYVVVSPNGDETTYTKEEFERFEKAISDSVDFQVWQKRNQQ